MIDRIIGAIQYTLLLLVISVFIIGASGIVLFGADYLINSIGIIINDFKD